MLEVSKTAFQRGCYAVSGSDLTGAHQMRPLVSNTELNALPKIKRLKSRSKRCSCWSGQHCVHESTLGLSGNDQNRIPESSSWELQCAAIGDSDLARFVTDNRPRDEHGLIIKCKVEKSSVD